jgi:hypothetical protein
MTRLEKEIDRLARDICWAGFLRPKTVGCTKIQYWQRVTDRAKGEYRLEARQLLSTVRRLGLKRLEKALTSTDGTK